MVDVNVWWEGGRGTYACHKIQLIIWLYHYIEVFSRIQYVYVQYPTLNAEYHMHLAFHQQWNRALIVKLSFSYLTFLSRY